MTVTLGLLAMLEARPGKGDELGTFLIAARDLAVAEEGTVTWYAFKISDTCYGIFDTFATDDARTAHIDGQIPAALANVSADLLASAPEHPAGRRGGRQVTGQWTRAPAARLDIAWSNWQERQRRATKPGSLGFVGHRCEQPVEVFSARPARSQVGCDAGVPLLRRGAGSDQLGI
jgi:hypothetical protein